MTTKSLLSNVFAFSAGVAVGGVVAWKLSKEKAEQRADREIADMDAYYQGQLNSSHAASEESGEDDEEDDQKFTKQEITQNRAIAKTIIHSEEYTSPPDDDYCQEEDDDMDEPYVISPDEYDDGEYNKETLVYYSDGVLVDAYDDIIQNVDEVVGPDALSTFGQYEKDTVFVRNDNVQIDYEICKDYRKSTEVL